MMESIKKKLPGILTCFIIAVPSWLLGKTFPIIGGPVIAILAGMLITMVWKNKGNVFSTEHIYNTQAVPFCQALSAIFPWNFAEFPSDGQRGRRCCTGVHGSVRRKGPPF